MGTIFYIINNVAKAIHSKPQATKEIWINFKKLSTFGYMLTWAHLNNTYKTTSNYRTLNKLQETMDIWFGCVKLSSHEQYIQNHKEFSFKMFMEPWKFDDGTMSIR